MTSTTGRVVGSAQIQITLEIRFLGTWGPDCTIDQIHKQAKEEAFRRLNKLISSEVNTGNIRVHAESLSRVFLDEEQS